MENEGWRERKIRDCIELIYGKGLPERQRKKGNIPVFGSNGIVGFHDKAIVKSPGIIIGRKGSVGEITFSKQDFWPIDTTYYVQTKQGNDIGFWYYFLKTLDLNRMNTHSAVPGLNRDNVYEIVRAIPNFIEQRAIASILGSLDNKIALNRSMNSTLEAIGQALFRRWFIDFEFPNEEGKPYKSSGGEMMETELGEVPVGWEVGKLGDIADNPRRGVQPDEIDPHIPYIGLEHMPRKNIALEDWDYAKNINSNKSQFHKGNILFGKLRPYFHKVGIAAVDGVCSTDILVIVPKKHIWYGSVLFHISSVELVDHADATSTGTRMPRTNWDDIARFQIMLPPNDIAQKFTENIQPLILKIQDNILQSHTLVALRNILLPKLMSGQIRVPVEVRA